MQNTAVYTFWTVGLTLGGGLVVALLLNREMRGMRLVRTLMLAPWIVPSFVVAVLWQFMWQSDVGIVNKVLVDYTHILGERPIWLLGDNTMWAIVIPSVWRGLPFAMIFFLAGLQAIPNELHEAAAIDGAGPLRRFRHITLPLLRPLIAVQLLFGVIYAAYQFAIPYIMLGSNPGPDADLMMTLIYRQSFSNNLFGFGAAASTLLMLAMGVWVLSGTGPSSATWRSHDRSPSVNRGRSTSSRGWCWRDARADRLAGRLLAADRRPALDRRVRPAAPDADGVQPDVADASTSSAT